MHPQRPKQFASLLQALQKVRLWHFRQGSSSAPQVAYDVNNFWTPQQAKLKRGALQSPASGSGMKRSALCALLYAQTMPQMNDVPKRIAQFHIMGERSILLFQKQLLGSFKGIFSNPVSLQMVTKTLLYVDCPWAYPSAAVALRFIKALLSLVT